MRAMFIPEGEDAVQFMRSHVRQHVRDVSGGSSKSIGIELVSLVRMVSNLYEAIGTQRVGESELSAARCQLLLRLMAEEQHGDSEGLTPSFLSRCQPVSKNTISALLRGLEEQDLIQRTRDKADLRIYRIRLSEAGRKLVHARMPVLLDQLNELIDDLTPAEQSQLADLLQKLYCSLRAHGKVADPALEQG